jgi:hypothetical protein
MPSRGDRSATARATSPPQDGAEAAEIAGVVRLTVDRDAEQVERLLVSALSRGDDHAFARGQERYSAGDLAAAETLADLVIGLDETHANATHLAGAIAAGKGRHQQAFDLFSRATARSRAETAPV